MMFGFRTLGFLGLQNSSLGFTVSGQISTALRVRELGLKVHCSLGLSDPWPVVCKLAFQKLRNRKIDLDKSNLARELSQRIAHFKNKLEISPVFKPYKHLQL